MELRFSEASNIVNADLLKNESIGTFTILKKKANMKIRILGLSFMTTLLITFSSCDESTAELGGSQSEFGEIGIRATSTNAPAILQGATAEITDLEGGVSVLTLTADFSEADIETIQDRLPGYDGTSTYDVEYRVTSEGVQSVYDDGTSFTLVKYDAKVGDKYTLKRDGQNLVREVVQKSEEDDYYWNGLLLKTITVKETGRAVPGFSNAKLVFNHRFGLVGYEMYFEDGSSENIAIQLVN